MKPWIGYAQCVGCGRSFQLRDDGTVRKHRRKKVTGRGLRYTTEQECPGSLQPPRPKA